MADFLGISTDNIPYLKKEERIRAREYMYLKLREIRVGVKDAHYSVYTDKGYEIIFNKKDKGNIFVAVLLVAPYSVILERRRRDSKDRPINIQQIRKHSILEKDAAINYAKKMNVPLFEIENLEDNDHANKELADILREYCS